MTIDNPIIELELRRTDYFTICSVLRTIKKSREIRADLGSIDPALNRVPHSFCLHFIVRFADGQVLCTKRSQKANSNWDPGRWSFSGEEQLSESDMCAAIPSVAWFQRALCEEVYALRDELPLTERWDLVKHSVKGMSVWSMILQEGICNFDLFGVYSLSIDPQEFVSLYRSFVDKGLGSRDPEGKQYVSTQKTLESLLFDGQGTVQMLFAPQVSEEVYASDFHPTSRYRIFRLLRALKKRPLI